MTPKETPAVVLIFFRRADCAARCLDGFRGNRPPRLWLVQDGPRPRVRDDREACATARRTVEEAINWPCEVRRLYAEENLGPSRRIQSALDAVFASENEAVILEEDCIPHRDFLPFCGQMLGRYAEDARVGQVSGCQFVPGGWIPAGGADYSFAQLAQIWGWATWRRCWERFDPRLSDWPSFRRSADFSRVFPAGRDRRYWRSRLDAVHAGKMDVWDYRWAFTRWRHGMLGIVPRVNLVSYAGFRDDALHTKGVHPAADLPCAALPPPAIHPPDVVADRELDAATARILFSEGGFPAWWRYQRERRLRPLWRYVNGQ